MIKSDKKETIIPQDHKPIAVTIAVDKRNKPDRGGGETMNSDSDKKGTVSFWVIMAVLCGLVGLFFYAVDVNIDMKIVWEFV